jgi:hypothetical protein
MDWVEVFAPVVFEPQRPTAWPETGSLLLDDLPFSVRDATTNRQRIVFRVFCAMGYDGDRHARDPVAALNEGRHADPHHVHREQGRRPHRTRPHRPRVVLKDRPHPLLRRQVLPKPLARPGTQAARFRLHT